MLIYGYLQIRIRNEYESYSKFSDEYLARCSQMSPEQIAKFLDDFRKLHGGRNAAHSVVANIKKSKGKPHK